MPRKRISLSCWMSGCISILGLLRLQELLEIVRAAQVLVHEIERRLGIGGLGVLDESAHGAVAVALEAERAFTGAFELLGGEILREAQDPLSAAQSLLDMLLVAGLGGEHLAGSGAYGSGTFKQSLEGALDDGGVGGGPVGCEGVKLTADAAAHVGGNQLTGVKHLQHVGGEAHFHALPDQAIGHGVIGALELDVIVGMDLGAAPLAELIGARGQRLQCRTLDRLKARAAAP